MPGAIKAFRAKGQAKEAAKKAAKRRATTDLPHGTSITSMMFRSKEIIPKKFMKRELIKKFSPIGLGRTKEGRKTRSPKVPFERGRIGLKPLRKKTRKSSRDSARKSGR